MPWSTRCASSGRRSMKSTRVAAANDRVTVDFTGTIDGVEFDGGSGKDVPITIGAGRVMKEFEDALVGAKAGDAREFNAKFPADHANPETGRKAGNLQGERLEGRGAAAGGARRGVRQELRNRRRQSRQPAQRSARQHGARAQRGDSPEDARAGAGSPVHATIRWSCRARWSKRPSRNCRWRCCAVPE